MALLGDFVPNFDQLGGGEFGYSGDFVAEVDLEALQSKSTLVDGVEGGVIRPEGGTTPG